MKANDLVHIIRKIVAEEIRKELPTAISEVFQNFMGKRQTIHEESQSLPVELNMEPDVKDNIPTRQSLRELFNGTNVMRSPAAKVEPKKFTKNPLLNEILNDTRPFNSQERHGAPMGAAAMAAAVASQYGGGYDTSMPDMGHMASPHIVVPPVSQTQLMSDSHVPMATLPEGVSVLDVKDQVPDIVSRALKRNYSDFMKKVESKVKR